MFGRTKYIVAGVLVFVLLVAGVGGAIVFAQGPTPTPSGQSNPVTLAQLYLQSLAQKLGITTDKLQQAETDARKDALAQAVQQGLLTQAQADRLQNAPLGGLPGMPKGRTNVNAAIRQAELAAAAKALGMTTSDLTTALRTQTLLALAQSKNVDATTLRNAIADAEKAAIDQAVKGGTLTQTQADSLKANIKPENIDLNQRFFGGMPGRFNGPAPFNGFGGRGTGRMYRQ